MRRSKLFYRLIILLIPISVMAQAPTAVWINEFHYDNTGADVGEFVEVVVNQSFSDFSNLRISFYRADGTIYDSRFLSSFTTGTTQDGFTVYSKSISIQNGPNQGLALDYSGTLISGQFLSYEGTLTAIEGPAIGLTSTDIGVSETSATPVGNSLYLTGTGTQYSDFSWTSGTATAGTVNGSQSLPVELTSFSASIIDGGIRLDWQTETEVNNYGFEVLRSAENENWNLIGFIEGSGNSNSPKKYSFIDNDISSGKYAYRLKQIDNDGSFEYSKIIEIDIGSPLEFELSQNYPNPFNPSTTIKFSLPTTSSVNLSVYNILGEKVITLLDETKEAGVHTINFNASELNSGIYFYKLETVNFLSVKKMSLLK
jgi:Secretion system C-terminal sorting domain